LYTAFFGLPLVPSRSNLSAWTCALYGVKALPDQAATRLQAALLYNKGDRWRPVVGGEDEAAGAHVT
jgi:hypothetical protein